MNPPDATSEDLREQAAAWLARWKSQGLAPEERHRFDAWLAADVRNRREFETLCALWDVIGDLADSPAVQAERCTPASLRTWSWRPALATAFVLVVTVGLVRLFGWEGSGRVLHIATAAGERRTIELDDGSRLHIDANSSVTAHLAHNKQRVVMERGEAWFEVEHRPERRFEVEAGAGHIVDIGTRFGVRLDDGERVTVAVAEGEVEVGLRDGAPFYRLGAGQGTIIAAGDVGQPLPVDAEAAFAWREGRIVFENTPLGEAMARVNRYRAEPFTISDPGIEGLRISGVFRIDDHKGFVWALEQSLSLRAVQRSGRIEFVAQGTRETETPPVLLLR